MKSNKSKDVSNSNKILIEKRKEKVFECVGKKAEADWLVFQNQKSTKKFFLFSNSILVNGIEILEIRLDSLETLLVVQPLFFVHKILRICGNMLGIHFPVS